jgi:hypothetical protein
MARKTSIIYVSAVSVRSGSNYFYRLLNKHPDCFGATPGEDYFLHESDHLLRFVDSVYHLWNLRWPLRQRNRAEDIISALGKGILDFLYRQQQYLEASDQSIVPVAKTPNTRNVGVFPNLFPDGYLLILIRDGRAVTESMMQTWETPFDQAVQKWKNGAGAVCEFIRVHGRSGPWHQVIHYEDLVQDTPSVLRSIFEAAHLDPDTYPYDDLETTKVVGSSTFKEGSEDDVWTEQEPDDDFDPLSRFASWTEHQHKRFEWLAGNELRELGYPLEIGRHTPLERVQHALRDLRRVPSLTRDMASSVLGQLKDKVDR